jgi:uncharacterized protein
MIPTLPRLRRAALAWSLAERPTPQAALDGLGFVQADPIRAPARAQDLTLRQRVAGYRAGDLDRAYQTLDVEEDFFINYGFLPRGVQALMHPRGGLARWPSPGRKTAQAVLAFVRERGRVHPRDVDLHFGRGTVVNYWGGSSSATTHALDHLHYRGLLRVVGRESGIRLYAPREHEPAPSGVVARRARLDALVDVLVAKYAPVPSATLAWLVARLRLATPQWRAEIPRALARARLRLAHAQVGEWDWYWPADRVLDADPPDDRVRLLAPFDPVVWDRRRFEGFWEWPYRFEAYTPAAKRRFGYYALPLLWRERVIGWSNLASTGTGLRVETGYVTGAAPRDRAYRRAYDEELDRFATFLQPPTVTR